MREVGIDLSRHKPKRLTVEMQLHADGAITMGCGDVCPYVPTTVDDWDIPDPAGKPLDDVRAIRDAIQDRVADLLDQRIQQIKTDATAHHSSSSSGGSAAARSAVVPPEVQEELRPRAGRPDARSENAAGQPVGSAILGPQRDGRAGLQVSAAALGQRRSGFAGSRGGRKTPCGCETAPARRGQIGRGPPFHTPGLSAHAYKAARHGPRRGVDPAPNAGFSPLTLPPSGERPFTGPWGGFRDTRPPPDGRMTSNPPRTASRNPRQP
jgi:hypothetical protein